MLTLCIKFNVYTCLNMRFRKIIAILGVFTTFSSCSFDSSMISPSNSNIKYYGRVVITDNAASFCYPGTSVNLAFSGASISARLKCNAGYYLVEIDSLAPYKLSTYVADSLKSDDVFLLADSLGIGEHKLKLTLLNEGLFDKPELYGFLLPSPSSLVAVEPLKHTIEFIGDSQTCGYGVESNCKEDGFADSTENYSLSFASIVAKRFNAEPMVVARSGIGVYRNFDDTITGSQWPIPAFYEQTFIYDSPKWNFQSFNPEIICVVLGTNDLSSGEYDLNLFHKSYLDFVTRVSEIYPKAKLILASGAMLQDERLADQRKVLDMVAFQLRSKGGIDVYRFDFSPQDGSLGYGADWHPSKKRQLRMADELTSFIESIDANWKITQ